MKIGISAIAYYLPQDVVSNIDRGQKFDVNKEFLRDKIGVLEFWRADGDEMSSDMALRSLEALEVEAGRS